MAEVHCVPHLSRRDNLVEQCEHRSMASAVIDVNECRGAVTCTQSFVPKLVSHIEVMSELVSRRDYCA